MSDFNQKLDAATSRVREEVERRKDAAKAELERRAASEREREAKLSQTEGAAIRLSKKCKEVIDRVRTEIPGGLSREYSVGRHGFAGCSLEFGDAEYLALKVHFDAEGLQVVVEARCRGTGIVYTETSQQFELAKFGESAARQWIETRAIEAYEAFGRQAHVVRNPLPIVTIGGAVPS